MIKQQYILSRLHIVDIIKSLYLSLNTNHLWGI